VPVLHPAGTTAPRRHQVDGSSPPGGGSTLSLSATARSDVVSTTHRRSCGGRLHSRGMRGHPHERRLPYQLGLRGVRVRRVSSVRSCADSSSSITARSCCSAWSLRGPLGPAPCARPRSARRRCGDRPGHAACSGTRRRRGGPPGGAVPHAGRGRDLAREPRRHPQPDRRREGTRTERPVRHEQHRQRLQRGRHAPSAGNRRVLTENRLRGEQGGGRASPGTRSKAQTCSAVRTPWAGRAAPRGGHGYHVDTTQ